VFRGAGANQITTLASGCHLPHGRVFVVSMPARCAVDRRGTAHAEAQSTAAAASGSAWRRQALERAFAVSGQDPLLGTCPAPPGSGGASLGGFARGRSGRSCNTRAAVAVVTSVPSFLPKGSAGGFHAKTVLEESRRRVAGWQRKIGAAANPPGAKTLFGLWLARCG